ncbi:hypothetical protein MNBD_UNCLBAC01-716 [hydrothermal vent metagenome]|uniref:Response regulatory domain-containing protein n=1 Tax=hydrothermal vent metagenome TaxID=652676 RepID=A0A3B1DT23_9ZZZZ
MSDQTKVLIVDDEVGFTEMLKLNLESVGYKVGIENDSENAIMTARRFNPDLILLDIIMPKKEGPDVFAELREHTDFRNTPIIFLTATVTHEEVDTQEGFIGGRQFIAKPSSLDEILYVIEKNIKLQQSLIQNGKDFI